MGTKFFYRDIDLIYFVNNKLINSCTSTARAKQTLNTPFNVYLRYPRACSAELVKNLINQKDRVLLSFSGGQDSICFVFILNQLYCQLELDITFFWCHHLWQIDSFYLMQQIVKLSFLFQFNSCFPIPLSCISSELLARKWRQSCSYRVSLFYNYSKICLAHTFNDKVENIFLNFIRGTGLIGLTPLRWIQLTKRISKPNIILNNFVNTAYSFFCIPPYKSLICKGISGKQRRGNALPLQYIPPGGTASMRCYSLTQFLQIKDLYNTALLSQLTPCSAKGSQRDTPYTSSDKSSICTCKGLKTRLFFCRCTNSSCVIIDSKRNKRNVEGMVPTNWNPPAIVFSLRGDPRAVARENPNEKYISRHNYPTHIPYKFSDKSSTLRYLNPIQVAQLTPLGLRLGDLSEDLCGNEMFASHGLATCKGYSYSNSSDVWKLNGNEPVRSKHFIPSNAYLRYPRACSAELVKEMCIPSTQGNFDNLKNLTKEIIRKFIQKGSHTPLAKGKPLLSLVHKKSKVEDFIEEELAHWQRNNEVLNPLQVAQLTPLGLRLGDLSEDLYGVGISLQRIPAVPQTNFRFVLNMHMGSTATCKEYTLVTSTNRRFVRRFVWNAMCGLNKPLNKVWDKQLLDGCYIVRPLLSISRIELNKICYFWELPIYPDKSNQKVKFLRNRVRGQLLPAIKLFFNLNIENIFLQLAKIVETEDYCLTQIVNEFTKNTNMYHTKLDIYSKRKK